MATTSGSSSAVRAALHRVGAGTAPWRPPRRKPASPSSACRTAHGTHGEALGRRLAGLVDRRRVDVLASRTAVASASRSPCMTSRMARHLAARRAQGQLVPSRPCPGAPASRRPAARSRGPTSTRTGTPCSSQSVDPATEADLGGRRRARTRTPAAGQLGGQLLGGRAGALLVPDEQHDDLGRREPRRQPQAGVVAVGHDQAAHHPGATRPRTSARRTPARPSRWSTASRRPWRSSGPARGSCPSGGPCRRPSSPRRPAC